MVGTITELIRATRRETFAENLPEPAEERPLTRMPMEQRGRERGSSDRRRPPRREHRRPYVSPVKYPQEDAMTNKIRILARDGKLSRITKSGQRKEPVLHTQVGSEINNTSQGENKIQEDALYTRLQQPTPIILQRRKTHQTKSN